ncbi:MAG: hypothetical protein ACK4VP_02640 [Nitrospira sp.]
MRLEKKKSPKDKEKHSTARTRGLKPSLAGYGRKAALLEEALSQMNEGRYGKASTTIKELLAMDPHNMEARRLFATLHLRLGSLLPAKQAFDSLIEEALARQDYWLAESLLREYLSVGPRCVPYLEKLGTLYEEKGQILEAVAEYAKAIEILIENPDPDDLDHASRLYRHIRDLAPASPAVIRLNRYWDPNTGALTAQPVDEPAELSIVSSAQGDQLPTDDSPRSTAPVELESESESAGRVESYQRQWSNGLSPLASRGEPLFALQQERRDGEAFVTGEENTSQIACAPLVDGEHVAKEAMVESTVQWSPDESYREADEPPSGSIADGLDPLMAVPSDTMNGARTVSREPLSDCDVLTTDEVTLVSIKGDQRAPSNPPSPVLELQEEDQLSVAVKEEAGQFGSSLTTERSLECSESPDQPAELPEQPVDVVAVLLKMERQLAHGGDTADQHMEDRGETSSSMTRIDGLERIQELREADAGETMPMTEATVLPVDKSIELGDELVGPAIEAELPPDLSGASHVDSLLLEADPVTGCSVGEPLPDESVPAMPLGAVVSEGQMQQATGDSFLTWRDEEGEEQSVAAWLDPSEESAHTITGPEVVQISESSGEHEHGISQERGLAPGALVPFTPPLSPVEECEQEDEAGARRDGTGRSDEQEQQDKEQGRLRDGESPFISETEEIGGEAVRIGLEGEQEVKDAFACETSTWFEDESQEDQLAPSVGPNEADPSAVEEAQVFEAEGGERLEVEADDPVTVPLRERRTEQELLQHGVAAEEVSPAGNGPAFVRRPSDPASNVPSSNATDTTGTRSQSVEGATTWSPQEAVHLREAVSSSVLRTGDGVAVTRSTVAEAVEVLFPETASSGLETEKGGIDRTTKRLRSKKPGLVNQIRSVVTDGLAVSLSTASVLALSGVVLLCVLCMGVVLAIGVVGLIWMVIEESPSVLYEHVTTAPPRIVSDPERNGYLMLVGFNAPEGQDPLQVGWALLRETVTDAEAVTEHIRQVAACVGRAEGSSPWHAHAVAAVLNGWVRGSDPLGALRANQRLLRSWIGQEETALSRYRQWLQLPFEDWGFGKAVAPLCDAITFAHHLYLAEGFLQEISVGIDRLEMDTEAWRTVLAQARTLPIKVLAIEAVRDNAAFASALLADPDVDATYIGRLAHLFRPLNQTELSIRWPMHSELAFAASSYEAQLEAESKRESLSAATIASWFPLPNQRRLNAYAAYYDAAFKAANAHEGWRRGWPKRKDFVRFPAETIKDVLVNPIENLVGLPPLPAWDDYAGRITDAEAHLRLVGLQAWIRRGEPQVDLFARIARAGQRFYDPYTGLPMLVNMQKGVLYSVGYDGKDQNGDPQHDVVVAIPLARSAPSTTALFLSNSP